MPFKTCGYYFHWLLRRGELLLALDRLQFRLSIVALSRTRGTRTENWIS